MGYSSTKILYKTFPRMMKIGICPRTIRGISSQPKYDLIDGGLRQEKAPDVKDKITLGTKEPVFEKKTSCSKSVQNLLNDLKAEESRAPILMIPRTVYEQITDMLRFQFTCPYRPYHNPIYAEITYHLSNSFAEIEVELPINDYLIWRHCPKEYSNADYSTDSVMYMSPDPCDPCDPCNPCNDKDSKNNCLDTSLPMPPPNCKPKEDSICDANVNDPCAKQDNDPCGKRDDDPCAKDEDPCKFSMDLMSFAPCNDDLLPGIQVSARLPCDFSLTGNNASNFFFNNPPPCNNPLNISHHLAKLLFFK